MSNMSRLLSYMLFFRIAVFPLWAVAADAQPKQAEAPKSGDAVPSGAATAQTAEPPTTTDADAPPPKPRKTGVQPTSIDIVSEADGLKTLAIHFRWTIFPDASLEVRLVPGAEEKGTQVAPIYFHEHLTDRAREYLYDCLDHSDKGGRKHSFTKDKTVYNMIGRRNSLGNQGVHVQACKEDDKSSKVFAAVYLQLDTWAVDKDTLTLDLARDEFTEPGTLFVWFFRGSKAIWEEQVRWPGYK